VLDWRLDPTGRRHPPGPLPWLPGIPSTLAVDPVWGPYLTARADLVTTLASIVRTEAIDWTTATAPAWAQLLLGHGSDIDPLLAADLAAWRAVTRVKDDDRRPTGPPSPREAGPGDPSGTVRTRAENRHERRLARRVAAVLGNPSAATARWAPLADTVCVRLVQDPYWPVLADRLAGAERAGSDVARLMGAVAAERPLPDEHPAAALWWRLTRHLPATVLPPDGPITASEVPQEPTTSPDSVTALHASRAKPTRRPPSPTNPRLRDLGTAIASPVENRAPSTPSPATRATPSRSAPSR